jgi:NADPH-dependent curcumin reductase CurA
MTPNRRWRLTRLPGEVLAKDDFALEEAAVRAPADSEVQLRTRVLSLDPYQRAWMAGAPNYGPVVRAGDVPIARAISEVVESRDPRFAPGDAVLGETGWQSHPTVPGDKLQKLDASLGPLSTFVGVLGSPGLTAWVGIEDHCRPKASETVLVSAAAGAVGSVAGQLALMRGARVVGIAGAPEKCRRVVEELGFAACVSHRGEDFRARLAAVCPEGIDAYFDNTGGPVTAAAWSLLRKDARVALCGLVAEYALADAPGPNLKYLLSNQATVSGFSVRRNIHRMPDYRRQASAWIREGKLRYAEDITDGLENAPSAFDGLLAGRTFGKCLVKVSG